MTPPQFQGNAIFWIEVEKIKPNPYQPRKEFDEARLRELGESIRQYGVLQPLVVTRREFETDEGGLGVEYELIAGERRLRAARLAGLREIPATIRIGGAGDDKEKLELAIIENLQREDLSPIDRARAFAQLVSEFSFTHTEVAKKVGKSREYVSNTIRLLALPQEVIDALTAGKISEGHTRPILMLSDRPEEQTVLFKEILYKKITVREAEQLARRVAYEKVRKHELMQDPELLGLEEKFTEKFGTRVRIEKKSVGGKLVIDFFSHDDLASILETMETGAIRGRTALMDKYAAGLDGVHTERERENENEMEMEKEKWRGDIAPQTPEILVVEGVEGRENIDNLNDLDDRSPEEIRAAEEEKQEDQQEEPEEEIYSVQNFTI